METTTIRIPTEKRDILKVISSLERRDLKSIVTEMIDEFIERHQETLDLLSKPQWIKDIQAGKKEIRNGIKGKSIHELDD